MAFLGIIYDPCVGVREHLGKCVAPGALSDGAREALAKKMGKILADGGFPLEGCTGTLESYVDVLKLPLRGDPHTDLKSLVALTKLLAPACAE
jgi:hypothetical protein